MNDKTKHLLDLIRENPDLPIVPMVDYEVVSEDWGRWLGSFGHSEVGEYALYNDRYYDDREDFKDAYYNWNEDFFDEQYHYNPMIYEGSVQRGTYTIEELEINNQNEALVEKALNEIADGYFTKAILVNIDLPD